MISVDGENPKYNIIPASKISAMKKSINFEITGEIGIIRRGKYTFVIIPDELNKLPLEPERAAEKYVHGTKAVKLKIAYGTPFESIFARFPNTIVNTIILNNGWITAQPIPRID